MTKALLSLLLLAAPACSASAKAADVPRAAVAIGKGERACSCVLLHLTPAASPTRGIDRARLESAAAQDPNLCAYELTADDIETDGASPLRPYLMQAKGAPIDLARRPGEAELHLVDHVENPCGDLRRDSSS